MYIASLLLFHVHMHTLPQLENAGELLDTTLTSSRGRQCTGKAAQDAWIKALRDQVQAWKAYASKAQDGKLGAGNVGEEGGVEGRVGKGEGRSGGDLNRVAELEMMLAQQRKENARMEERVSNLIAETAAVKDEVCLRQRETHRQKDTETQRKEDYADRVSIHCTFS